MLAHSTNARISSFFLVILCGAFIRILGVLHWTYMMLSGAVRSLSGFIPTEGTVVLSPESSKMESPGTL